MPVELARVAIALGVVFFGFLLAHIISLLAMRVFRRASTQFALLSSGASEPAGLPRATEAMTRAQAAAIAGSGRVAFWLVFTLFLGAGTSLLGFPVISSWLASMAAYLPRVLASVAILLLGVLSGLFVRVVVTAATRSSSASMASPLGKAAQISVVLLAAAMAIEQLGVQITLLVVLAAVVVGALLGGASLAFALGARSSVSNILACPSTRALCDNVSMRQLLVAGMACSLLVACGFDIRSSQYACETSSDCESGRICEMNWCVVGEDTGTSPDANTGLPPDANQLPDGSPAVDASPGSPDAAPMPGTITYTASIADCINPDIPDPDVCESETGSGQMAIDLLDTASGSPNQGYLRFNTGGEFAGKTVTSVTLRMTATDDPKAPAPNSGRVFQAASFTRSDLFVAAPSIIGVAPLAGDQGMVMKDEVVNWALPVSSVSPNSGVYFALLSQSMDGVNYWNLNGSIPPVLIVDYQ